VQAAVHMATSAAELRVLQVKPEHAVQAGLGYMKLAQVEAISLPDPWLSPCAGFEGGGGEGGGGEGGGEGVRGNWKYALHLGVFASRGQSVACLAAIFTVVTPLFVRSYPSSVHMHCACSMQCFLMFLRDPSPFGRPPFAVSSSKKVMKRADALFISVAPHLLTLQLGLDLYLYGVWSAQSSRPKQRWLMRCGMPPVP
jgi:hypothetical protein